YTAGAGAPLRSGHRRGARLLSDRSRELARRAEPGRVKPVVRRRALLVGVGLLVAVLVGGRWLALETAERAWGASLPGGTAYLTARDFARLVSGLLLIGAVAWGTANLLFVYRSIGSMQLSRRLGDLEIVEAVPQPLLLAGTIACGLVFGFLLTLGTGDWWMSAALASRPPTFGVTDPVLHQDLGYYLGVLLALLALTLTWGAVLDPAETVAGLHGTLTHPTLGVRLAAAPVVSAFGAAATVVSLVWGLREKPVLLVTAWSALLAASLLGFAVIPGSRGRGTADPDTALAAERQRLEGLAFGVSTLVDGAPPGFPGPEAAATAVPIWDAKRVLVKAASRGNLVRPQSTPAAAGLLPHSLGDGRATWLVALRPEVDSVALQQPPLSWAAIHRGPSARVGRPFAAVEDDTLLAFAPVATRDSTTWFGPGFTDFAVAAPDSWPALRQSGVALAGWWRRTALAWALQSPALARRETDGLVLLWRRAVPERLGRLAPFASFDDAVPLVADSALWWVAYGYFEAQAFPLARPVEGSAGAGSADSLRYLHA